MAELPASPSFGELLAGYRRAARFTRAGLARQAGVSDRSIRYLEAGEHRPYADTIDRLATALGLSAHERTTLERAGRPAVEPLDVTARPDRAADLARRAPDTAATSPHNLPARLTSFIGREREQAEVDGLLRAARLVTLTGPGGVGKTRLVLEVAAGNVGAYPDGVWLVELGGVSDARLVPEAVAGVVVQHEQGRREALAWLADALRSRKLLLVLDNCEHLAAACAELIDHLLRACPDVQILATSRETLGVVGEHIVRVPPLRVPADATSLVQLRHEPAVRLFVARAEAASSRFRLTEENAAAVAEICRRLDGLPLAIELAAGRTAALTAGEIATRLDDRFRLLTAGGRTRPERHQTLRAVVTWSYELASEPCRRLFARLAPFAGGWTLEAAEQVCADPNGDIASDDVLAYLGHLIDQSLVHTEEEAGETRYRLLETLRAYAAERLEEYGETEAVRRRHAEHHLALAEAAEMGLRGPEQARWAARLAREYDNIQAALRWTTESVEAILAHRLVGALWAYWHTRPRGFEGSHWYERVLAMDPDLVPPAVRARALSGAGGQAMLEGQLALAEQRCQESLTLFQQALGESNEQAHSLVQTGLLAAIRGEFDTARTRFQDALATFRRLGIRRGEAWTLGFLGQAALSAGAYERAGTLLGASGQIMREIGDAFGLATTLVKTGELAFRQGQLAEAQASFEESVAQFRAGGLPLGPPTLLHNLACVLRERGEAGRAKVLFMDGLELYRDRGDDAGVARCLLGLSELALDAGELRLAARLLGAADRLPRGVPRGLLGGWTWTAERRPYEQQVEATRAMLGETTFEVAFAEGRALTPEQALAEVRHERATDRDRHVSPPVAASVAGETASTLLDLPSRLARRSLG